MFAPGAPGGGAGWTNEVERWLLFRCRNSQERSGVTVREGPVRQFWQPQVYQPATRVAGRCLRSRRATSTSACNSSGPTTLAPRRACTAQGRMDTSTQMQDFAADSLHLQRGAIAAAIRDCDRPTGQGHRGCTDISVGSRCSQLDIRGSHPGDEGAIEAGRATDQEIYV